MNFYHKSLYPSAQLTIEFKKSIEGFSFHFFLHFLLPYLSTTIAVFFMYIHTLTLFGCSLDTYYVHVQYSSFDQSERLLRRRKRKKKKNKREREKWILPPSPSPSLPFSAFRYSFIETSR